MQIVGYETGNPNRMTPVLLVAANGAIKEISLTTGTKLSYTLKQRHCAGRISEQSHESCSAPEAPYCPQHTDRWPCARCRGQCSKPIDNCEQPHVVYLAVFAPALFKVGVTKSWRLSQRLYEQGADHGALIEEYPDGRAARQREAALAEQISDRIETAEKLRRLHRSVDRPRWNQLLDRFDPIEQLSLTYDIELSGPPVPETTVTGQVRGVKGRVLLLDANQTTYAVDLRNLIGQEITQDGTVGPRQSSLSSF